MFNHSGRKSFYLWADCAAVRKTEACQAGWVCPEPRACGGGCAGPPCGERESGAAAFATPYLQKQMLENEGVEVLWTEDGWRVDLKRDGWKNTMDEALWLREEFDRRNI